VSKKRNRLFGKSYEKKKKQRQDREFEEIRKVRKSRKNNYSPFTILGYEWVSREVNFYASRFQIWESIVVLKKEVNLMIFYDTELLIVEPCSSDQRVFLKASKDKIDFIYLYEDVFKELHVQLPFTNFECEMLSSINVVPVQIHPNSWAFLQSFQIFTEV